MEPDDHVTVRAGALPRLIRIPHLTKPAALKGHILVPAFAIGRTQTLLYHLNTLIEARRIPELPVAVDTPFGLRDVPGPMLIIAGSGMCTGGRMMGHLQELLPVESTTLLFVGFQAPGTGGHAIQQAAANRRSGTDKSGAGSVWLDNEKVQVRAQIETISGLSAHADRQELRRWLSAIPQPQRVALHHGEVEAQRSLQGWLGE